MSPRAPRLLGPHAAGFARRPPLSAGAGLAGPPYHRGGQLMTQPRDFEGMYALVTGGASGIGAAAARCCCSRGARVAVLDRESAGAPDGTLAHQGGRHRRRRRPRRRRPRPPRSSAACTPSCHNAGRRRSAPSPTTPTRSGGACLDINVLGMVRVARHALPHLRRAAAERPARLVTRPAPSPPPPDCPSAPSTAPARARSCPSPSPWPPTTSARASASTASTPAPPTPRGSAGCSTRPTTPRPNAPPWRPASPPDGCVAPTRSPRRIVYLASPAAAAVTGTALAVDGGMQGLRLRPRQS